MINFIKGGEEGMKASEGRWRNRVRRTLAVLTAAVLLAVPCGAVDTQTTLELYQGRPAVNEKIAVRDMLPGDSMSREFCVKAYHDTDVTLHFRTRVTEEVKALGDVLHIKVIQLGTDEVLCDGPFSQVKDQAFGTLLTAGGAGESTAYYQIDVSLDTAVGNEYQQARLLADFEWYVEEEGGLTPPPTGEAVNTALWIALAVSGALLVVLLLFRRRKEEESHG